LLLDDAYYVVAAAGAEGEVAVGGARALLFFLFFPVFEVDLGEVLVVFGEGVDLVQF
jgi:hypothetical protein